MSKNRKYANIDSRLLRVLDELARQSDFVSMKEFSKRLNMSRRQIEYDLNRLDDIFEYLNLSPLMRMQNKGIKIRPENIAWYSTIFRHKQDKVRFHYNSEERTAFIIIHIIIGGSSYGYTDFCDKLSVSRTTIFQDLNSARKVTQEYNSVLDYDIYYNYIIEGTGKDLMLLLKSCANVLFKNIPKELFKYLVDKEIYNQIVKL